MKEKLEKIIKEFREAEKTLRGYESFDELGRAIARIGELIAELEKLAS